MSITVPPSVNYPNQLISSPCLWAKNPSEGSRFVPGQIAWGSMGGTNKCVDVNLYGLGAQTFSQIAALSVDNSGCGADVQFIFPDTQQTYTVPAYTPQCVVPVFTNTTNFYIYSPNSLSGDITNFAIHNDVPPPISVPTTQAQNVAANSAITLAAGTTQIIPAGTTGTLENLAITVGVQTASVSFNFLLVLQDGSGKVLAAVNAVGNSGGTLNALILALQGIAVRFQNGVSLIITGSGNPGGTVDCNAYYKIP